MFVPRENCGNFQYLLHHLYDEGGKLYAYTHNRAHTHTNKQLPPTGYYCDVDELCGYS